MFRKAFSILLSLFILGSVPGFKVFVHYCNGHASEISFQQTEPCDLIEFDDCGLPKDVQDCCDEDSDSKHTECKISHDDCCNDKIIQYEGNRIVSFRPSTDIQPLSFDFDINLAQNSLLFNLENANNSFLYNCGPPQTNSGRDICIEHCTFII